MKTRPDLVMDLPRFWARRSVAIVAVTLGICVSTHAQQLVGHWKLDNDLTDSTGLHNGTMSGTETHVFGEIGKAVSLDGSSQIILGTGVVPTTAYTKSAWVWCAGVGTNSIFSGDDSTSRHVLWVPASNGGKLSAGHNGNYTAVQDSAALPLSQWVHIAVTYDSTVNGGTMKLYKNGALVSGSQAIVSNVSPVAAGSANIGGFNGNGYWNGIVDDVGVWNGALSDSQIQAIYNTGLLHVPLDRTSNSVFNVVPEANQYTILYELPIPNSLNLGMNGWPPYITDYSQAYKNPFGFDRVAYYLELQSATNGPFQWVYVSMDRFSTNTINLGVPSVVSGSFFQQNVTNMNVFSNTGLVPTGTNIQTGNIEFWGWQYIAANGADVPNASGTEFDTGDAPWFQGTYGSMQIHDHATNAQTLVAYNGWGGGGNNDVGIGNSAVTNASTANGVTTNSDWSFAANAPNYAVKNLLVLIRPATLPNVTFTSVPRDMQVYPRNVQTDLGNVAISGTVNDPGYDQLLVQVTRQGAVYTNVTQALTYSGGQSAFSLTVPIFAELANYNFTVSLIHAGQTNMIASAANVVAGDYLLVNGQSNAEAQMYNGSADGNQSPFIRSFGTRASVPQAVTSDLNWHMAEGDLSQAPAAVGQWSLRAGRLLVDTYQVPLCIINEAYPGQPIIYFKRNDSNPLDLTTNYGCLLYRVQQAGAANAVRAILWYQGESDYNDAAAHEYGFLQLYRRWLIDYPSVEKVYVHQIRPGSPDADVTGQVGASGHPPDTVGDLRNRQRLFADKFPGGIEVMSTSGVDGQYYQAGLGFGHYSYVNGYELIGEHAFNVMARDLYGAAPQTNIDPPNFAYAFYSTPLQNQITIITRQATDSLIFQSGAQADFHLVNNTNVTVLSGTVSGNTIVLTLSAIPTGATGISYLGHAGPGQQGPSYWVVNTNGVGLLNFYNQMINPSATAAPDVPSGLAVTSSSSTELDLQWNATTNAAYYIILRNGVQIGTTYDTQFYDRTVMPNDNYMYSVEAVGLVSTSAPSATITALSSVPQSPPNLIAFDNVSDPVYLKLYPQWVNGDNGGFGFGPWTLTTLNNGGYFTGDSTQNGVIPSGGINTVSGQAWGLWSDMNNGSSPDIIAYRRFNQSLGVGQTFEIYVDTGLNTGTEGFVLRTGNDATGKNNGERFEFLNSSQQNYAISGSVFSNTAVPWTDGGVKVDFTLTSLDTYSVTISGLVSGVSQTLTGALQGTVGSTIDSVALYDENKTSGQQSFDLYFNSMSVISEPRILSFQILQGTNAVVTFSTIPNFLHDLQANSDLITGTWSTVVSDLPGTGGSLHATNPVTPTAPQQFFRVKSSSR